VAAVDPVADRPGAPPPGGGAPPHLSALFEHLLPTALDDAPILAAAAAVDLAPRDLEDHLRSRRATVLAETEPAQAAATMAERDLEAARAEALAVRANAPYRGRTAVLVAAWIAWILFVAWSVASAYAPPGWWPSWLPRPTDYAPTWLVVGVAMVTPFVLGGLTGVVGDRKRAWAEASVGLSERRNRWLAADRSLAEAVVEAMKRELLEVVSTVAPLDYSLEHGDLIVRGGLEEMAGATTYELARQVHAEIRETMARMRGGALGVAGPRGVGKTTLLRSLTAPVDRDRAKPPEQLSIFTSAPVEYQGRDFILHLLTMLCERVLLDHERPVSASSAAVISEAADALRRQRLSSLAPIFVTLLLVGLLVLGIATTLAVNVGLARAAATIALTPGPLVLWGVVLAVVGTIGVMPSLLQRPGLARLAGRAFDLLALFGGRTRRRPPGSPEWMNSPARRDICQVAQELLNEARYQSNYTSGWTGALKFPVAAESGLSSAISMAKTQLSLPELVARYRTFLSTLTREPVDGPGIERLYHRVTIVIDELDKLASDELAQRFVNEIKAVFGVPGCYYLLSISETAMSSFERRGIRFRDAFDSALDDVFRIECLPLAESRRVIRRRIFGFPEPFVCYAHVMSGGLPRDLIRECRSLVIDGHLHLPEGVQAMVRRDLTKKLLALRVVARGLKIGRRTSRLLAALRELETVADADTPIGSMRLMSCGTEVLEGARPGGSPNGRSDDADPSEAEAAGLALELGTYLVFLATVVDIFHDRASPARIQQFETTGGIERLARAREMLSTHPLGACTALAFVREEWLQVG
jgi:hypothetical protein